ncbi:MAG: diacylglycerol/lipid kinase family protein [Acidimicrobiales bacterium]
MNRLHLVRSPTGGSPRSRRRIEHLLQHYRSVGIEPVDLTGDGPDESRRAIRDAREDGLLERLVVVGGDGLVNLVVQELAMTEIPVGIVPTGTGNDFAAALGVEGTGREGTVGPTSAVDLVRVTPSGVASQSAATWVASIAILGFPAAINARANRMRLRLGPAIYAVSAALELPTFRRNHVELEIDGEHIRTDTAMLAIGNTRFFGGGMLPLPDARHDDGLLHLTSIEGVGRLGMLPHLLGRKGGTADRPEVLRRHGTRVSIESGDLDVWGDGEQLGTTPATIDIVPGALHVAGIPTVE